MITATEIFCLNEIGKRSNNEDCISPQKGLATLQDHLFVVCDGVGGEKKGGTASEIVCTSIQTYLANEANGNGQDIEAIKKAIEFANRKLVEYAATDHSAKRMSTTLALAWLGETSVITAWCGDTRVHHIRNGKIMWKSKDHSLVSELVSRGELTEEEARSHPQRNVITRSLNALNLNNDVDFHEIKDFETGDYILLCTDGLLEKINDTLIYKILNDDKEKNKDLSFLSYCDGVTKDNFSMYLIRASHTKAGKTQKSQTLVSKKVLFLSVIVLLLIITALLFLF